VEANYAAEPQLFRNIYEAYAGVGLGRSTWLDAGILPSHIGFESALTPANRSWSRSLIAENSPYYEAGVRLTLQPTQQLTVALLALNGWQNIRETNDGKAVGLQVAYRPTELLLLNYSNYIGDEAPSGSDDAALRFFHDVYAQLAVSDRVGITAAFDIGSQQRADGDAAVWHGGALLAHVQVAPGWTVCGRTEYYHDPDQAIVNTGTNAGLDATSGRITDARLCARGACAAQDGGQGVRHRPAGLAVSRWSREQGCILVTSLASPSDGGAAATSGAAPGSPVSRS
jgi:hypothetical protein